jgi:hypothetical protein
MQKRFKKSVRTLYLLAAGAGLFQAQGCTLDPDIVLRAQLSAATDLAIFILENLTASF